MFHAKVAYKADPAGCDANVSHARYPTGTGYGPAMHIEVSDMSKPFDTEFPAGTKTILLETSGSHDCGRLLWGDPRFTGP